MARKLIAPKLLLLCWLGLAGWSWPQPPCAGCDCPQGQCYSPGCDCTLPLDPPWCQKMLQRIRQRLEARFGEALALARPLTLRLVPPRELLLDGEVQGSYLDGTISLSSGLSRSQAIVVLAHEFGHAWQDENHPRFHEVDGSLREGWAEWLALQTLKSLGEGGGEALRRSQDPAYGGGLRWFLQVESNFGLAAVLDIAKTWMDGQGNRLSTPATMIKELPSHDDPSLPDDLPQP